MSVYQIEANPPAYRYAVSDPPLLTVESGARVEFHTLDARGGALAEYAAGSLFELPPPPVGRGNPPTGPLVLPAAKPGDALAVTIERIECESPGWVGAHAGRNPASPGVIPRSIGRICALRGGQVEFSPGIGVPMRPMIGCIGTAPEGEPVYSGDPGRHGGNLDHPIVGEGSRVYLPVWAPGAYLYIGDVHAAQGDAELSSIAVEVPAVVTVRVDLVADAGLQWPWVETPHCIAVLTSGPEFTVARQEAVDAMVRALGNQLGMEPGEALAFLSIAADLRIGQAFGGMDLTLRLEVPSALQLKPL